jgi:molybdate transport system ATP-binding protein
MAEPGDRLLLGLEGISVRVGERLILENTFWQIRQGQQWAVLGPNASGKTALARALVGQLPCARGTVARHFGGRGLDAMALVSFELHRQLMARDAQRDLSRFAAGRIDFATARQTIQGGATEADPEQLRRVTRLLGIEALLERPLRFLSNGETRKTLIARALMRKPELLVLDEPFDGLDAAARGRLETVLRNLIGEGLHLMLITHRQEEIIPEITHVLCLKECRVVCQGERGAMLTPAVLQSVYGPAGPDPALPHSRQLDLAPARISSLAGPAAAAGPTPKGLRPDQGDRAAGEPLVELRKVTVRYGDTVALRSLDWTMRRGEHWAVLGPNGSGKTTLISLIYADNLQAYTNDIRLFGRRRGSGESIWEIKRRIGHVSPHLQVGYRLDMPVFDVVVSGFFDSVGLYRRPTDAQRAAAREWIELLGVAELAGRPFGQLSYGERRLAIIVRALVKGPELLALDEPCQGLDPANRTRVLAMVDRIGFGTATAILYVTHRPEETPRCITHTLRLSLDP